MSGISTKPMPGKVLEAIQDCRTHGVQVFTAKELYLLIGAITYIINIGDCSEPYRSQYMGLWMELHHKLQMICPEYTAFFPSYSEGPDEL